MEIKKRGFLKALTKVTDGFDFVDDAGFNFVKGHIFRSFREILR
jgi:hypothetical protein